MPPDITETDRFVFFWGGWPSQWFKSGFAIGGIVYTCAEQYMMAEKARVFGDGRILELILQTSYPREQKELGRNVRNFDPEAWNRVCRGIVYAGNLVRFSQNRKIADLLLATGEKTIVEASPKDRIWGIGLAQDDPRVHEPSQWQGTNWLGVALMQVRDALSARAQETEITLERDLQQQLDERARLSNSIAVS